MIQKPKYPRRPIRSLKSLALALGLDLPLLVDTAGRPEHFYTPFRKPKPDGTFRLLNMVLGPLSTIQGRIESRLLKAVELPPYLHGSVKGRSRVTNAEVHRGAETLISLDISKFFDNARKEYVLAMFNGLFHFQREVSELLTALTTLNCALAQGASTSPLLANLLFWRDEWLLVDRLSQKELAYTRFVDDVAISSARRLSQDEINQAIGQVRWFFQNYQLSVKNRKTEVARQSSRMLVNKLVVNDRIAMQKRDRLRVRAAVHQACAAVTGSERFWKVQSDSPARLKGRLVALEQFHPKEAEHYYQMLAEAGVRLG